MILKTIKEKKGSGHVEVIISFIIFIGFLIFLFAIFNPFKKTINENLASSLYNNIEESVTENITSTSISINNNIDLSSYNCFTINELSSLNCNNVRKIIVKNSTEGIVPSMILSGKIIINKDRENRYYTIHCSEEISSHENIGTNCIELNENQYLIGQFNTKFLWSEKKLIEFENNYKTNYDELKKSLMQGSNDFSFNITNLSSYSLFNGGGIIPRGIEINSETIPIELLDNNARIKNGLITIIVW